MKRFLAGLLVLISGAWFIMGCGDDEDPISAISFEKASEETSESDGGITSFHPDLTESGVGKEIKVNVKLDRAAAGTIVLSYTVGGSALKRNNLSQDQYSDFALNGATAKDTEKLIIESGATEAVITLTIYEDFEFEIDDDDNLFETITLTLNQIVSGPGSIAETNKTYELKINEDDLLVVLLWDTNPATTNTFERDEADLDLFAWLEGDIVNASDAEGQTVEGLFIPAGFPDGTYGFSYTYYEGTANTVDIYPSFFGNINGRFYAYPQEAVTSRARYTLANINKYNESNAPDPAVVQTIIKTKTSFGSPSTITVPTTGSRIGGDYKPLPLKGKVSKVEVLKSLLNKYQ